MTLKVSPEAIKDIAEIKEYISESLDSPIAADKLVREIVKAYKGLKTAPYMGTPLDSVIEVKTDFRRLVCRDYIIFYKVEGDTVFIYRIINGRRDYCRILFG